LEGLAVNHLVGFMRFVGFVSVIEQYL
jgi:hypothetical protein